MRQSPRPWRLFFYSLPLLLAALCYGFVSFKTDLSAFIVNGENAEEMVLASEMQSGVLSRRYLLSIGSKHQQAPESRFIQALIGRLKQIDQVADVWLPEQKTATIKTLQTLYVEHATSIYSLHPEQDLPKLFSSSALQQKARFIKQALLSPQASLIKPIVVHDPLLLTLNGFQALSNQFKKKQPSPFSNLILESIPSGMNAAAQQRIQQSIRETFKQLDSDQRYQLEMTGVPIFAVATQKLIQGDIVKISLLSTLALMLLFGWIFRSLFHMFQVFTLLIIAILSAILATDLVFGYVHGMTIAIGATLTGICIDYPVHALVHCQQSRADQAKKTISTLWPSMLLGGATTLIGYLALGVSGYPGFQQVAVFAVTGILVALLVTRYVLPLLIKPSSSAVTFTWLRYWLAFCERFRKPIWIILFMLSVLSLWQISHLQWMEDMQQLTPELDALKQQDKRIRSRMVSIEPGRFILISGDNTELALEHAEQAYRQLDRLKQQQALSDYFGLFPWLLSARQQQLNQQALKTYLIQDNLNLWRISLKQQGLSVARLGHFNYSFPPALTLEQVLQTPVKRLIDGRIMPHRDKTLILVWLSSHNPIAVNQAFADTPYANYFSQRDLLNNMLKQYTQTAKKLLLAGLGLIIILMLIRYRSLSRTILTLSPALLSALFILSSWALSGTAISFLHLVAFLLVVAICVDYGIFFQENRGGDIFVTYQAIAISMLTSALAFGSMIAAQSTSLKIIAGIVSLGVFLGFLFCPIMISHRDKTIRIEKDKPLIL